MLRRRHEQRARRQAARAADTADNHRHHAVKQQIESESRSHIRIHRRQNPGNRRECRSRRESRQNHAVRVNAVNVAKLRIARYRPNRFAHRSVSQKQIDGDEQRGGHNDRNDLHVRNMCAENLPANGDFAHPDNLSIIAEDQRN